MDLTQFSDIFGAPRTGIHAWRIADAPVVDVLGTVAAAYATSKYMEWDFAWTLAGYYAAGAVLHAVFGVDSRLTVA